METPLNCVGVVTRKYHYYLRLVTIALPQYEANEIQGLRSLSHQKKHSVSSPEQSFSFNKRPNI
jgi:hypothetical protein